MAGGLDMDNFTYKYALNANRLSHVTDASTLTANYTDDINSGQTGDASPQVITASQLSNNYQYDSLGQLVKDVQAQQVYKWRTGDKKLKLQKSTNTSGVQSQLEFVYNPLGQRIVKIRKTIFNGVLQSQSAYPYEYTYYAYDANGQVMATYNVTMNGATNTALLDEQMIYGAERLGAVQSVAVNVTDSSTITNTNTIRINQLGRKNYELTNHLGNVNAVITDRKVLDLNYVAGANYEFSNATLPTFTKTGSCGVPTVAVTNGQAVVTSGACTTTIYSDVAVSTARTYTFSVDIDRSGVAGFDVELYYISSTGSVVAQIIDPTFINVASGRFTYTFTPPSTTAFFRYKFSKTSTPAGVYKLDNLRLNTVNTRYMAVMIMRSDYYPFGMQMPGRTYNTGDYRYGYNGMEKDKEMKGEGNSYTTEFRQYDSRLGRWLSLDPLMMMFPDMSPYVAFNNNPVYFVDPLGLKGEGGPQEEGSTEPEGEQRTEPAWIMTNGDSFQGPYSEDGARAEAQRRGGTLIGLGTMQVTDFDECIVSAKRITAFDVMRITIFPQTRDFNEYMALSKAYSDQQRREDAGEAWQREVEERCDRELNPYMYLPPEAISPCDWVWSSFIVGPIGGAEEAVAGTVIKTTETAIVKTTATEVVEQTALQFSKATVEEGIAYAVKNKSVHVFNKAAHNLDPLVNALGGQEAVFRGVLNAVNGKLPASGVFEEIVNVAGYNVTVRGSVINGVPKIGTMFIP